jgi:hypothetical protein
VVSGPGEREVLPGQAHRSVDSDFGGGHPAGNGPAQNLAQRASSIIGCEAPSAQCSGRQRERDVINEDAGGLQQVRGKLGLAWFVGAN